MCRRHRSNSLPRWIHQVWHPSSGNSRSCTPTRASAAGLAIRRACVNCSTGFARHCVDFRDRFRRAKSSRPRSPTYTSMNSSCYNSESRKAAHLQSMTKVGFVSLGCPKNLVDSEVMMGILEREGYELTPRADEAEVLVVNTCSFIESAQKESVDAILEMAEHKKFGAAKKLIVAGCLVERFRAQILEQVPEVDAVVGTGEVARIK